jgi:hypothetical protein
MKELAQVVYPSRSNRRSFTPFISFRSFKMTALNVGSC